MRPLSALFTASLLALALAACGSSDGGSSSTETAASTTTAAPPPAAATTTATAPVATAGGCKTTTPAKPGARDVPKPTAKDALPKGSKAVVKLQTSCGPITIQLDTTDQDKTASSFAYLVGKGFYDGLTFHRVSAPGGNDFVVQGGDPLGTGEGGPGWTIVETPPADAAYTRGVVAMAKTGAEPAGTSGSQFFIVTADNANLPADYAIAGKVTDGDQTVRNIAAVKTDPNTEQPLSPVVIDKATLVSK